MQEKIQKNNPKNNIDLSQRRRTLSRLMAVQIYYQFEFFEKTQMIAEIKNNLVDNYVLSSEDEPRSYRDKIDATLLENLLNGLPLACNTIDEDIKSLLKNEWTIDKIPQILLYILRFGAFELKFSLDIPLKVLVNEYVDLAALFFDPSKIMFANSTLENLAKKYRESEFAIIKSEKK